MYKLYINILKYIVLSAGIQKAIKLWHQKPNLNIFQNTENNILQSSDHHATNFEISICLETF